MSSSKNSALGAKLTRVLGLPKKIWVIQFDPLSSSAAYLQEFEDERRLPAKSCGAGLRGNRATITIWWMKYKCMTLVLIQTPS